MLWRGGDVVEGKKRAWPLVLAATVLGGLIGYAIGNAMLPENAELEGAVYPVLGALAGAALGLVLSLMTVGMARSKRGRGDI